MRVFLVAAVLLGTLPAAAADHEPTLADLDALAGQKAWTELLEKARDLPAGKRDAHWQELVNKAAEARVNDASLPDRTVTGDSITLLQTYPRVADDRAFMDARNRRAMIAIRQCFAESTYDTTSCRDVLMNVVRSDPKNAELARDAAVLTWRNVTRKGESVDAYDVALAASRDRGAGGSAMVKEICASDELRDALADAMVTGAEADKTRVGRAKVIAFAWCWSFVDQRALANAVVQSDTGRANACTELLAKKVLGGVNETKCKNLGKK